MHAASRDECHGLSPQYSEGWEDGKGRPTRAEQTRQ